jgi:hypothetical protein
MRTLYFEKAAGQRPRFTISLARGIASLRGLFAC